MNKSVNNIKNKAKSLNTWHLSTLGVSAFVFIPFIITVGLAGAQYGSSSTTAGIGGGGAPVFVPSSTTTTSSSATTSSSSSSSSSSRTSSSSSSGSSSSSSSTISSSSTTSTSSSTTSQNISLTTTGTSSSTSGLSEEVFNEANCEYARLGRNADDYRYTNVIPKTGFSDALADKYDAYSILPSVSRNYEYYEALVTMVQQGVMSGQGNNIANLDAGSNVNRAETSKMILMAMQAQVKTGCLLDKFGDVRNGEWFNDYVHNLEDMGIVNGYADGNFGPANPVRLGELAKMLVNSFNLGNAGDSAGGHWATNYMQIAASRNIIASGLKGTSNFDKVLTRGEVADMIFRTVSMKDAGMSAFAETLNVQVPKFGISVPAGKTLLSQASVWMDDLTNSGAGYYHDVRTGAKVVFAHSSIWPFDPTPQGAVFQPLVNGLNNGDEIIVGGVSYSVTSKVLVSENDVSAIRDIGSGTDLVVFTCDTDITDRWVYTADRN